ncbi:MAG: AsmA family protein [Steroidobacteraceae bacterium]
MARPSRRLIRLAAAVLAGLLLLLALAVAALLLFVDADRFRPRIEALASRELGRSVALGRLHWDIGWRLGVASQGGSVANAPGFDAAPLASWQRLSFDLALRPLLDRRVLIDGVSIDGLALDLQRDASGAGNWNFPAGATGETGGEQAGAQIAVQSLTLKQARIRYRDAASGADWRVESLDLALGIEPGKSLLPQALDNVGAAGRLFGGPLPDGGVQFAFDAPRLDFGEGGQLSLPQFTARLDNTRIEGRLDTGQAGSITGKVAATMPSLRAQLAVLGITAQQTRDPQALGPLRLSTQLNYAGGAVELTQFEAQLDDTRLQGGIQLPALSPLALRFTLEADAVDVDRYLEPEEAGGDPFQLPLAALESMDARGVIHVHEARFAGFTANDIAFTVE